MSLFVSIDFLSDKFNYFIKEEKFPPLTSEYLDYDALIGWIFAAKN